MSQISKKCSNVFIEKKIPIYKWNCIVQTHAQGSPVYIERDTHIHICYNQCVCVWEGPQDPTGLLGFSHLLQSNGCGCLHVCVWGGREACNSTWTPSPRRAGIRERRSWHPNLCNHRAWKIILDLRSSATRVKPWLDVTWYSLTIFEMLQNSLPE